MNSGKVALGVLAAAATGAILGILFAPAKGDVLRRKIRMMGEKEMDDAKEKYNEFTDKVTKNYEKVKENVTDFAHKTMSRNEAEVKTAESN
ncbi:MAG: YtxH domain-containing protein [Paludibacter sp.]|nr:YtxH domain-containing protein [Paludibacter sp.]